MKLKELESALQAIETFSNPKVKLEQYQTSPHIAARILYSAEQNHNSFGAKSVADLGCGSGIFTVGPLLLGADSVLGIDIDEDALDICRDNVVDICVDEDESCPNYDLLQVDVVNEHSLSRLSKSFDTVIMNPPFGTKVKGVDMIFLQRALDMATECVYSLHKSSTRDHIKRRCRDWNVNMQIVAELKFDIPNMYKYHKHKSVDVEVDFIRFSFD
ncbi:rRNA N6-adenosine-methyltransferase METTL5 [Halotydeus destructor]|nr:rRNA N6-adenosine-methyltransferase METTL5 [Halotydeus destructor]